MTSILNLITLLIASLFFLNSQANTRQFKAVNGKEKLYLESDRTGEEPRLYMMIQGTGFPEDKYVFMVKQIDTGIVPYNEAAPIGFYESEQLGLNQSTDKKMWSLLYKQKNILMTEVSAAKEGFNLADKYKAQEAGVYAGSDTGTKGFQKLLSEKCKAKPEVQIKNETAEFATKVLIAGEALASLCKDKDYKEAISKIKRIELINDSSLKHRGKVSSEKGVLTVRFSDSVVNTFYHIKVLLEDSL